MEDNYEFTKEYLKGKLNIGTKIEIGKNFAKKNYYFKEGQVFELIQGYFEYDNGLYFETQTAPSIYNKKDNDYDSIYHLFGNDLDDFMDCKII